MWYYFSTFDPSNKQKTRKVMKIEVQFIWIPSFGGSLYRIDNGEQLPSKYIVVDCHGNYTETTGTRNYPSPLSNGEIIMVEII